MAAKRKMTGAGVSIPVGIVIGVAVSVGVLLVGTLLAAYLVMIETISLDGIGVAARAGGRLGGGVGGKASDIVLACC